MDEHFREQLEEYLKRGFTMEQIARHFNLEWDGKVAWQPGWYARMTGDVEIYFPHAEASEEAAEEYVSVYEPEEKTYWCTVYTRRKGYTIEDKEIIEINDDNGEHFFTIDPEEPPCTDTYDHDWVSPIEVVGGIRESPGCWGHGGGVIMKTICRHCGWYRIVDTWDTDPATGKQGLYSITYVEPDERSLAWVKATKQAKN